MGAAPAFDNIRREGGQETADGIRKLWRELQEVAVKLEQHLSMTRSAGSGKERSVDPPDPVEGNYVRWMSDGTGAGDDGDIMMKITAGGATKTATLVDFSAV
jgi:hypothetical protein